MLTSYRCALKQCHSLFKALQCILSAQDKPRWFIFPLASAFSVTCGLLGHWVDKGDVNRKKCPENREAWIPTVANGGELWGSASSESENVSRSVMSSSVTPWTVAHTRLLCLWDPPGQHTGAGCWDLPDPGIKPRFRALQAESLPSEPPGKPCFLVNPSLRPEAAAVNS